MSVRHRAWTHLYDNSCSVRLCVYVIFTCYLILCRCARMLKPIFTCLFLLYGWYRVPLNFGLHPCLSYWHRVSFWCACAPFGYILKRSSQAICSSLCRSISALSVEWIVRQAHLVGSQISVFISAVRNPIFLFFGMDICRRWWERARGRTPPCVEVCAVGDLCWFVEHFTC